MKNIVANARAINQQADLKFGKPQVKREYTSKQANIRENQNIGNFNDGLDEKEGLFDSIYAAAPQGMTSNVSAPITQTPMFQSTVGKNNTKIPSFIKEEMENNPSDQSVFDPNPLNRIKFSEIETPNVQESTGVNVTSSIPPMKNENIDYGFIRDIINQCLENKLTELKGGLLTESASLNTIGLKNGVIKLVDNKGNIFKAKLEKVGNINDK